MGSGADFDFRPVASRAERICILSHDCGFKPHGLRCIVMAVPGPSCRALLPWDFTLRCWLGVDPCTGHAGRSLGVSAFQGSGETTNQRYTVGFSEYPVSSHGGWDKGALWGLFYEDVDPLHDLPSSQRLRLLIPSPGGVGIPIRNFSGGGHTHSDHSNNSSQLADPRFGVTLEGKACGLIPEIAGTQIPSERH